MSMDRISQEGFGISFWSTSWSTSWDSRKLRVDECVFYHGKTLYVLYTDDSLLAGPDQNEIDEIILDLKKARSNIT
jgi:hypothetical protein